jgi:putative PEP-CTERM system histidine kinase
VITSQITLWIAACVALALAVRVLFCEKASISTLAFVTGLVLLALDSIFGALSATALDSDATQRWYQWRFIVLAFTPSAWLAFSVTYARGNYTAFWRRWLPAVVLLAIALPAVAILFRENLFDSTAPSGWRLGNAGRVLHVFLVLSAAVVLMNVERTFRAAVGLMRWQLKFMVIGVATLFLTRVYTSTEFLIFASVKPSLDTLNGLALIVCAAMGFVSQTRAKGFMLELYPSPTLLYRSFAVMLIGGYLLAIGFLAKLIAYFGTSTNFSLQAFLLLLAAVVLGLLSLSDRVRLHVKRFVSLHLKRPVYDVRKIWSLFSSATAGHMDENQLCRATVNWVAETFDVLSVTIWLMPQRDGTLAFGASTSLSDSDAEKLIPPREQAAEPLEKLREHAAPIDIDANRQPWLEPFRQCHPAKFSHGGNRICIPVTSANELVAVMMLGDRVAGVPFSIQDLDLLKCVTDQIAGDLVRIRLSRKLLEAKEMQAFQTMATFFVHDLKNTAWTLSLLVENLRAHFERPEFRDEAIRAVGKSVTRINDLIGRIGSLRDELRLTRSRTDANELVETALKECAGLTDVKLVKRLTPLPPVNLDKEQMHKVILNLLVNAREASQPGSEICLATEQCDGYGVIAVQDAGSGMSAAFMKERLFKPFQTTKKKGIGIGMFQSKMIVEAHGGRIEVQSKEGAGTTFRVLLPLAGGLN